MVKARLLKAISDEELIANEVTLDEVILDGDGDAVLVEGKSNYSAIVTAADITGTGATITFEASIDGTLYIPIGFAAAGAVTRIASVVVGADGSTSYKLDGISAIKYLRAVVGSRDDGTFTVTIMAN